MCCLCCLCLSFQFFKKNFKKSNVLWVSEYVLYVLLEYLEQANKMNYDLPTPTEVTMLDATECKEIVKLPCKYHPEIKTMYHNINKSLMYSVFSFQHKREYKSISQEISKLEAVISEQARQMSRQLQARQIDDTQSLPGLRDQSQQLQVRQIDDTQSVASLPSRPIVTPSVARNGVQLQPIVAPSAPMIPLNMILLPHNQSLINTISVQSLPLRPLSMPPTMQQQMQQQIQQQMQQQMKQKFQMYEQLQAQQMYEQQLQQQALQQRHQDRQQLQHAQQLHAQQRQAQQKLDNLRQLQQLQVQQGSMNPQENGLDVIRRVDNFVQADNNLTPFERKKQIISQYAQRPYVSIALDLQRKSPFFLVKLNHISLRQCQMWKHLSSIRTKRLMYNGWMHFRITLDTIAQLWEELLQCQWKFMIVPLLRHVGNVLNQFLVTSQSAPTINVTDRSQLNLKKIAAMFTEAWICQSRTFIFYGIDHRDWQAMVKLSDYTESSKNTKEDNLSDVFLKVAYNFVESLNEQEIAFQQARKHTIFARIHFVYLMKLLLPDEWTNMCHIPSKHPYKFDPLQLVATAWSNLSEVDIQQQYNPTPAQPSKHTLQLIKSQLENYLIKENCPLTHMPIFFGFLDWFLAMSHSPHRKNPKDMFYTSPLEAYEGKTSKWQYLTKYLQTINHWIVTCTTVDNIKNTYKLCKIVNDGLYGTSGKTGGVLMADGLESILCGLYNKMENNKNGQSKYGAQWLTWLRIVYGFLPWTFTPFCGYVQTTITSHFNRFIKAKGNVLHSDHWLSTEFSIEDDPFENSRVSMLKISLPIGILLLDQKISFALLKNGLPSLKNDEKNHIVILIVDENMPGIHQMFDDPLGYQFDDDAIKSWQSYFEKYKLYRIRNGTKEEAFVTCFKNTQILHNHPIGLLKVRSAISPNQEIVSIINTNATKHNHSMSFVSCVFYFLKKILKN